MDESSPDASVSNRSRAYEVLINAKIYALESDWDSGVALGANRILRLCEYRLREEESKCR